MIDRYDIAVIGSGFAGSLFACIAKRLGHSVLLIESQRHPRFAIGESSTPLANLLLEELTERYDLPRISPLAKWGTWQEHYPEVSCGVKRGFSFFHHATGQKWNTDSDHANQLLVAASPQDRLADTHWYRAELDQLLAGEAQRVGVDFVDEVKLETARESSDCMHLEGRRFGERVSFHAQFVVDASGPHGFLHRALQLPQLELPGYPRTQALYTHFTGVARFKQALDYDHQPPYPIDDAALHHVFDGGWIWVLHFNNGSTSAGVAALNSIANRFNFGEGAAAWKRLLRTLPSVEDQFAEAHPQRPFVHAPQLSFRSGKIVGLRWALLPSAAGFVDPLLSTGFPLTLLGVMRLGQILETSWQTESFSIRLEEYGRILDQELLTAARLISGLYANMGNFSLFSHLTLLYFAAASYSETARRLGKPELASSFLLHDHPAFGLASRSILDEAMTAREDSLQQAVLEAIQPIDIAGLGNRTRKNWYPVDAEDLLGSAAKLNASRDEISSMLARCHFWGASA